MDQVWILGSRREEGAEVTIESSLECSTPPQGGPGAAPMLVRGPFL